MACYNRNIDILQVPQKVLIIRDSTKVIFERFSLSKPQVALCQFG